MFRSRQAICAFVLVIAGALLPETGYCVEQDLYVYRLLFGGVQFEFERQTSDYGPRQTERNTLRQAYFLDTLGNIISRYIATYDAGIRLLRTDSEAGNSEVKASGVNYYLNTSILPRSAIPLSLYFSHYTSENEFSSGTSTSTTESESTRYGLNWEMKMRNLPRTTLFAELSQTEGQGASTESAVYRLTMEKKIGPSDNGIYFGLNTNDSSSGSSSETTSINIRNRTELSKATRISFGYSRGTSDSESRDASTSSTVQGISLGLFSAPGQEFSQSHTYSYYSSEVDSSKQSGQTYSGSMGYNFSEKLSASTSLSVNESVTETPTGEVTSDSFGYSLVADYRVNDNVSLTQSVDYSSSEDSAGNKRVSYGTNTGIGYGAFLGWASFSAGYGAGYRHEEVNDENPFSGLQQNGSVSLLNIDVVRYVLLSTSAAFSDTSDSNGSWTKSQSFSAGATNKEWTEYVIMQADYSYYNSTSRVDIYNNSSQNVTFSATSDYFRNTNFSFLANYSQRDDATIGSSSEQSQSFNASHYRIIYDGNLRLAYQYMRTLRDFKGGDETSVSSTVTASYNKRILGDVDWDINLTRSRTDLNDSFFQSTYLTNTFRFNIRAWFLSVEHRYALVEDAVREQVDNTYFLRISRNFVRFLNF